MCGGGGGGGLYSEVQYITSNGHMGPILKLRMRAVTILCGMELVVHWHFLSDLRDGQVTGSKDYSETRLRNCSRKHPRLHNVSFNCFICFLYLDALWQQYFSQNETMIMQIFHYFLLKVDRGDLPKLGGVHQWRAHVHWHGQEARSWMVCTYLHLFRWVLFKMCWL